MKKSYTLLELLVVVIIIGIVASLAMPQYWELAEKTKMAKAKNAINLIASAEFMYGQEEGRFIAFSGYEDTGFLALSEHIELVDIPQDTAWVYTVDSAAGVAFTIHAVRQSGDYAGDEITFTERKVWGGTGYYVP